jgi:hypothetical protein
MILCDHCGEPRHDDVSKCVRCGRTRGHWEPSEDDIRAGCGEIQATWSKAVERQRRRDACHNVEMPRIGVERCQAGAHGVSATYFAY